MFDYIPSSILPLGFIMFILSTVGIIGNIIMVYCSIFSKKLRSPCHILISITCLLDGLHISGQLPFCVHLFGNLTSSQAQCFYMLLLPIIGFTSGGPMILAMGIDRFVAVRFPSKYRYYQEEPTFYIIGQLIFPIGFILFFLIFGFFLKDVDAKNQIICANPLSLNGMSFQVFTYSSALIYISVFFLYLSVYLMLKSNKTSARFKRVFRSLAITVGLVLFGWATTTSANTLSYLITDDKATVELIQMYAGITVNAAAASNIFVFYAIKRLRSPCHILISLSCTADLLHLFSQFVFVVHLFGDTSSSQYQCFYMLLIPLCGIGASGPLILGMGIDRLIAVKFPTKYRFYQQEPKPYILSHLIFPIIYTICLLAYGFSTRIVDPKVQVQCAVPVSLNGSAFQFFTYSSAVIYFLVVVVYVSVYLLLKNSNASSRFKSVFKSISVTVGFVLFGWATTTLANTISYKITTDEFTMALIQMYAGVTVNMAAASNIFIFYAINSEYREIIKSIFGCKSKANSSSFEASSTNTIIVRTKSKAATTNKTGPSSLETGRRTTVV